MTRLHTILLALVAGWVLMGCGVPAVDFSERDISVEADDYRSILGRWTRSGKVYGRLEARLKAVATYKSWEWTHAAVERLAEDKTLPVAEKAALKAKHLDAYRARYEFVVAAWSAKRYWNDLDHKEKSSWRIVLEDDRGRSMSPDKVDNISETLRKLPTDYRVLFPYIDSFAAAYVIQFRRPRAGEPGPRIDSETRWFTLRFSGPLGRTDLVWSAE